jgi:hypothetical protein
MWIGGVFSFELSPLLELPLPFNLASPMRIANPPDPGVQRMPTWQDHLVKLSHHLSLYKATKTGLVAGMHAYSR